MIIHNDLVNECLKYLPIINLIENNENKIEMGVWAPAGKCVLENQKKEKKLEKLYNKKKLKGYS